MSGNSATTPSNVDMAKPAHSGAVVLPMKDDGAGQMSMEADKRVKCDRVKARVMHTRLQPEVTI